MTGLRMSSSQSGLLFLGYTENRRDSKGGSKKKNNWINMIGKLEEIEEKKERKKVRQQRS